jgi:dihydroxyacetone kinase phosphotransfer subunit
MTDTVSIVIVSHSADVARGAADMVRQMVGDEVRVAPCGGNPEGGLGTDVGAIMAAIESVWTAKGVAVLVDLGGAETNSEMAIELLGPSWPGESSSATPRSSRAR